jgi:hypothetical protein
MELHFGYRCLAAILMMVGLELPFYEVKGSIACLPVCRNNR